MAYESVHPLARGHVIRVYSLIGDQHVGHIPFRTWPVSWPVWPDICYQVINNLSTISINNLKHYMRSCTADNSCLSARLRWCCHMIHATVSHDPNHVVLWPMLCCPMTQTMLSCDPCHYVPWPKSCCPVTYAMLSHDPNHVVLWPKPCCPMIQAMLSCGPIHVVTYDIQAVQNLSVQSQQNHIRAYIYNKFIHHTISKS